MCCVGCGSQRFPLCDKNFYIEAISSRASKLSIAGVTQSRPLRAEGIHPPKFQRACYDSENILHLNGFWNHTMNLVKVETYMHRLYNN